ncbi:hypothetical protein [Streptomyces sp. NPDC001843]|uniref:hypothetical protein n=1 Tax=Streptomyces sp. NPDC001843 TaxID=3364617 RepID=UPI0036C32811
MRSLDPFRLEVHRAIEVPGEERLPRLPTYVIRDHDAQLRAVVDRAVEGQSTLVTLVGGSSTGKTRAAWEAVRQLPDEWTVWHPYDPTRPQAAMDGIARIPPRTVVWLNDAQHYLFLKTVPDVAERITAKLRTALAAPNQAPILVVATMWPDFWAPLTVRPAPGVPDPFAQQRELLTGVGFHVSIPSAFTDEDLEAARGASADDPRLALALTGAANGQITQYLAGVPELLSRYRNAPRAAATLIEAAMDYRRLGHAPALPCRLLTEAAQGYRDAGYLPPDGDGAADEAFVYCTEPCNGVPGPLVPLPVPRESGAEPTYRLADYLEQLGRAARRTVSPPATFWDAAVRHVQSPQDLGVLGHAAYRRARFQHALSLYEAAARAGNHRVHSELVRLREKLGDAQGAEASARAGAEHGDTQAITALVRDRAEAGDTESAEKLARLAAEAGDTRPLRAMAQVQDASGDLAYAERLYRAAAEAGDDTVLVTLAQLCEEVQDVRSAEEFAFRAAAAGDPQGLRSLAHSRKTRDDHDAARRLQEAADLVTIPSAVKDTGHPSQARARAKAALRHLDALEQRALEAHEGFRSRRGSPQLPADALEMAERLAVAAVANGDTDVLQELAWREFTRYDEDRRAVRLAREAVENGYPGVALSLARGLLDRLTYTRNLSGSDELQWGRHIRQSADQLARMAADAGDTRAFALLAEIRVFAGDRTGSERNAQAAMEARDTQGLNATARRWEEAGDRAAAEYYYSVSAQAGDVTARTVLMRWREDDGDAEGAEKLAHEAAAKGDVNALTELARWREMAGDKKGAEKLYRAALATGDTGALIIMGGWRQVAGNHDGAERLFRAALDAGDIHSLHNLAQSRLLRGDTRWKDALRYGLDAAGSPLQPW